MAAVKSNGIKFGISETTTMRKELNIQAIKMAIRIITKKSEVKRVRTKYFVPFKNTILEPVTVTLYFPPSNILFIVY